MYNDTKTARDRVHPGRRISGRLLATLSLVVIILFCLAGTADFHAVQAGLI